MSPVLRRWALVAHVTSSVGWAGSVAVFLVLAVSGLTSDRPAAISAAYQASDLVTRAVIVPLAIAAFTTGIIQSLGTAWGLFRNYWVIAKLVLTVAGTGLLLLHTRAIAYMAAVAAGRLGAGDYRRLRIQLVADAAGALLLLLVATWLSVFKPHGLTPYGWRRQRQERTS